MKPILLIISLFALVKSDFPSSLCGNNRVDPGEDCDGGDCCTSGCKFRQGQCANGLGVCNSSGGCDTRQSICSSFDSVIYQFSVPQNGETGVQGPYNFCYSLNNSTSSNASLQGYIQTNQPAGKSLLSLILPQYYINQASCDLQCSGKGISSGNPFCLDFKNYATANQNVPSGMGCLVDNTAQAKLGDSVKSFQKSPNVTSPFSDLMAPGTCQSGICVASGCRTQMCNGNGNCVLSQGAVSYVQQSLGISTGASFDSNTAPALVQCSCDHGFGGSYCEVAVTSSAGLNQSQGQNSGPNPQLDSSAQTVPYNTFVIAMIAGTVGTAALMLLLFTCLFFRYRDKSETDSDYFEKHTFAKTASNYNNDSFLNKLEVNEQKTHRVPPVLANVGDNPPSALYNNSKAIKQDNGDLMLPPNYLRSAHAYTPRLADEIQLLQGDILYLIKAFDDGWGKAYNLRSGKEGIFPLSFTKRIVVRTPNSPVSPRDQNFEEPAMDDRRSSLHSDD